MYREVLGYEHLVPTGSNSVPIPIPQATMKNQKNIRRFSKKQRSPVRSLKSPCSSFRCDSHPLDDSETDDDVFDDSFDRSSLSSQSSNSSFIPLKSNPFTSITNTNVNSTSSSLSSLSSLESVNSLKGTNQKTFELSLPKLSSLRKLSSTGYFRGYIDSKRNIPYKVNNKPIKSIELTTFNQLTDPIFDVFPTKSFKHRDERINNKFLKLYAIDLSSRKKGYLPNNTSEIQPTQYEFHNKYNLMLLSASSRDKLWQHIILPPRSDDTPGNVINKEAFIHVEQQQQSSLIMKNGDFLPWNSRIKSWKPCGELPNGKKIVNGENPNSGVTTTQYTVKGWCNSRWTDSLE